MSKKIESVIIVGGGSSGWSTAAALSKRFKDIKVTLIESKTAGVIGVGESTLADFNNFLKMIGMNDEKEWMPLCDATLKTHIFYKNFHEKDQFFINTMKVDKTIVPGVNFSDHLMMCKIYPDEFKTKEFAKYFEDHYEMMIANKMSNNSDGFFNWNYKTEKAYHVDATKLGIVLKDLVALPNGVIHIQDDVVTCVKNDDGIDYLVTKENGNIKADLYIDCTGFRAELIDKCMGVEWESFDNMYMNDCAWVAHIPYENKEEEMTSNTLSEALECGWLWNIPLWSKMSLGYVFSSKFKTIEEAKEEYLNTLIERYGDRARNIEPKLIRFKSGVRKQAWVKNVLAIGLSYTFLEPLNATGLMATHNNIMRLVNQLDTHNRRNSSFVRSSFNRMAYSEIYAFRSFVTSFYAFSKRDDTPYWKHVTGEVDYLIDEPGVNYHRSLYNVNLYFSGELAPNAIDNIQFIRICCGNEMNLLTDFAYEQIESDLNKKQFGNLKELYKKRKREVNDYVKSLPSVYEYMKNNIYKDYYESNL